MDVLVSTVKIKYRGVKINVLIILEISRKMNNNNKNCYSFNAFEKHTRFFITTNSSKKRCTARSDLVRGPI